jgi:hypothetical protein
MARMKISTSIEELTTKLQAAYVVWRASRIVPINKLTLWHLVFEPAKYTRFVEGFALLPLPEHLHVGRRRLTIPAGLEDFAGNLTYGQKLYLMTEEPFDTGIIMRYVAGYFYSEYTGKPWSETGALQFSRKILYSQLKDLYPVAIHLVNLMGELVDREKTLLHRAPTADERAAGVENLNRFSELTAMLFLMDSFRATEEQVLAKPYEDCLVRFMLAKEQNAYAQRLIEVQRRNAPKP